MFSKEFKLYENKSRSINYDFNKIPDDYFIKDMTLIKDFFHVYFEEIGDVNYTFEDLELHYDVSFEHIKDKLIEDGLIKSNSENNLEVTKKGLNFMI